MKAKKEKLHKNVHKNDALEAEYKWLAALGADEVLSEYKTQAAGLSGNAARALLDKNGPNSVSDDVKKPWYVFLFKSFADEFIVVLVLLGFVSILLSDTLGAAIIFILAVISAMLRFVQSFNAYRSSEKLKTMIHIHVDVRRDGKLAVVNIEDIVPGDVVEFGSGSIIPADLYIIEGKDLFVSQSMFTGESAPVEKAAGADSGEKDSTEFSDVCLMGCNVVSGSGAGVVIKTGKDTYLGNISASAEQSKGQTNFEKGLGQVTKTLIRYMVCVVAGVFVINGVIKQDWLQAFLFSVSVAVGITPGMLPMIVNATLSKGAQFLARKKTIVKNMSSIQNLGAIDVLCTDKTGTLTIDKVELQQYLNVNGNTDETVLDYAFLNSYFGTGIKNLIDSAIIDYGTAHGLVDSCAAGRGKIDEIPFDYERKRMSVVIADADGKHTLITKGAAEEILKLCSSVMDGNNTLPLTDEIQRKITAHADELNQSGMHVIAVAKKDEQIDIHTFSSGDEQELVFVGYVAFFDPPKQDVAQAIKDLYESGVDVKVLTGDGPVTARHICTEVGMRNIKLIAGVDIEPMTDDELARAAETANVFTRLAPLQKQRVVDALRSSGHVVGYLGDGVNDAPSLRRADVGISVDSAADIAKESSDIILLEKSLMVLKDGIYEGRRIYGNIMKYMKMALSSNFGNVFSVLVASIFLPFLPMIPIQILIQNLIYDFTQIAIPWDNVDKEFIMKPRRWDTKSLTRFMNTMGVTSSVFDMVTFGVLWFVLGYSTVGQQTYFQTGWFIEGLISQTLIVQFIRTSKIPFIQSRADIRLTLSTIGGIVAAIVIPYAFHGISGFNFAVMPAQYYAYLIAILAGYAVCIQIVKKFYIKRTGGWL